MTHVTTNFMHYRDKRLSALTSQYTSIIYEYLSQSCVGKYIGAPSELRDLTRESTTFWLSQASLQKTQRCYLPVCVFMGRADKLATDVLIYIYNPCIITQQIRY